MNQIDSARRYLESARELTAVLDAGWTAFEVLVTACQHYQDGSPELFAAWAFAAAGAARGRTLIATAPSLGQDSPPAGPPDQDLPADEDQAADDLAGLARLLHERLAAAAVRAGDSPDAVACAEAGLQAAAVHRQLRREP